MEVIVERYFSPKSSNEKFLSALSYLVKSEYIKPSNSTRKFIRGCVKGVRLIIVSYESPISYSFIACILQGVSNALTISFFIVSGE